MSFSVDIAKFARKTKSSLEEASRAIKISLFNGIVMDTRVDTGRLRGNWQTTTGQPVTMAIDRIDPQGQMVMAQIAQNVTPIGIDYMVNNLPYAAVWEEQDGMIAKNMARIQRTVEEVASGVRKA